MAPEMLLGKTDYDKLVDTWSLGCVMAEIIDGRVLFHGSNGEGQVCAIMDVLGVPNKKIWPWFASTSFATGLLPRLRYVQRRSLLRQRFPATMLSEQGFEVLSGLLTWNPDKRLTASAALRHPWFADLNAPAPSWKEGLAPALPKKNNLMIDHPNLHKRRKLQCA
jgi:cell division cycle 2-like